MAAYNMSKHAQEALTECLALELAPFGVRVVAIEPGVVATPIFTKNMDAPVKPSAAYRTQAGRVTKNFIAALADPAQPDAVADVIWRAATDDAFQLRHPATADGKQALEIRYATTDEAWLAAATDPDEVAWAAWQTSVRGYEVRAGRD